MTTISKKELLFVISRGFALLLITWAFLDLTYLPERVFSLSHHVGQQSVLSTTHDYWRAYYLMTIVFLILRVLALLIVAVLFWRCGPRVEALFSDHSSDGQRSTGGAV